MLDDLSSRADIRVIEFKRYAHNGDSIYRFTPLTHEQAEIEIQTLPTIRTRERKPHQKTWEARLEWASPKVKELVDFVKNKILSHIPNAIHGPRQKQRHYFFYTQEPKVHRNMFAVILIQKRKLRVRIRLPDDFEDPENITKLYKG